MSLGRGADNTPQAKCDVHRIDVNAINNEKVTFAIYRILGICDVHRARTPHMRQNATCITYDFNAICDLMMI